MKAYSVQLGAEAAFQVQVYRNFIADYLEGQRPYPIPGYTLQCVRNEALRAIRDFRLVQMSLLTVIYDPNTRVALADSIERTVNQENQILSVLDHFHKKALEIERAETLAGKKTHKLPLRAQRGVVHHASKRRRNVNGVLDVHEQPNSSHGCKPAGAV